MGWPPPYVTWPWNIRQIKVEKLNLLLNRPIQPAGRADDSNIINRRAPKANEIHSLVQKEAENTELSINMEERKIFHGKTRDAELKNTITEITSNH